MFYKKNLNYILQESSQCKKSSIANLPIGKTSPTILDKIFLEKSKEIN